MQGDLLRYSSGGEVGTAGHQQGHSSAWSEDTQVSPIPSVFCLPVTVYNWTYYLWHLRHQNIVVLMGYHVLDNISTIVTNYVRGGHSSWCRVCEGMGFFWHISMAILISSSCRSYFWVSKFSMLEQTTYTLQYMHEQYPLVHHKDLNLETYWWGVLDYFHFVIPCLHWFVQVDTNTLLVYLSDMGIARTSLAL